MKIKVVLFAMLGSVFMAALTASPARSQAQESDAKSILKTMSDYVSSQRTIELTFDSDIEVITPQLEKIQFTNSGEALLSRPDKLRAHRVGGYADVARRSTVGVGAPGVGAAPGNRGGPVNRVGVR